MNKQETVTLELKQYCVDRLVDAGMKDASKRVRAQMQYSMQYMAEHLCVDLFVLGKDIQDREICRYPTTLWQHIRKVLGLHYQYRAHRLRESMHYPTLPLPPKLGGHKAFHYARDSSFVSHTKYKPISWDKYRHES